MIKWPKRLIILFVAMVMLFVVVISQLSNQKVTAQEVRTDMRSLFEKIQNPIAENNGFIVAIQFVTPIVEGEKTWVLPDSREKDDVSVALSEIDDEYVCFDSLRGSARYIECTPYSNIASIRYLVE